MASTTYYEPLTTIFTPPADCKSSWTYEGTYYNTDTRGVLMQQMFAQTPDTSCFPSDWIQFGRAGDEAQIYSPGACPVGYSTAQVGYNADTTTAVCCVSGFDYITSIAPIDGTMDSQVFHGCTSQFPAGSTTAVPARANDTDLGTSTVSGQIEMWAQPMTVAFESSDLALFPASTTSSSASSSTQASSSEPTSLTAPASPTSSTSTTSSAASSATNQPTPSGLSAGGIAGVAIAAAAVLGLLIGGALIFRRKRSRSRPDNTHAASSGHGYHDQPGPEKGPPPSQQWGGELAGDGPQRYTQQYHELGAQGVPAGKPRHGPLAELS